MTSQNSAMTLTAEKLINAFAEVGAALGSVVLILLLFLVFLCLVEPRRRRQQRPPD